MPETWSVLSDINIQGQIDSNLGRGLPMKILPIRKFILFNTGKMLENWL